MDNIKSEEILTCFMLIIVGYYIAKMFSRRCNGFSVGGQQFNEYISDPNHIPNSFSIDCNKILYNDDATERDKALACNSFSNCTWNPFLKPSRCTYNR